MSLHVIAIKYVYLCTYTYVQACTFVLASNDYDLCHVASLQVALMQMSCQP